MVNGYDPFVASKMVNGTQMTVVWDMDDLKVSQKDQIAIDDFTGFLKSKDEKPDKGLLLTYNKDNVHDYLDIDLDYSEKEEAEGIYDQVHRQRFSRGCQRKLEHLW